ncbi:MAG: hypothetical protein NTV04_08860 [Deltaproteobacteria bacterium]|nr:hypothetical protein [Deltaproteobacteria bacterium]
MKVLEGIPNFRAGRNPDSETRIHLYEVGFRDWRFSHKMSPDTDSLVTTIRMLEAAGIERIEIGASVNIRDLYRADRKELPGGKDRQAPRKRNFVRASRPAG